MAVTSISPVGSSDDHWRSVTSAPATGAPPASTTVPVHVTLGESPWAIPAKQSRQATGRMIERSMASSLCSGRRVPSVGPLVPRRASYHKSVGNGNSQVTQKRLRTFSREPEASAVAQEDGACLRATTRKKEGTSALRLPHLPAPSGSSSGILPQVPRPRFLWQTLCLASGSRLNVQWSVRWPRRQDAHSP